MTTKNDFRPLRSGPRPMTPATGDEAVIDRMVREMRCGNIPIGACRGCGAPGRHALAEYERHGKSPKVELCFLCDDCRKRCKGRRIRFKLAYQPAWPTDSGPNKGEQADG